MIRRIIFYMTLFLFLFNYQLVNADCPHCFTFAHVNLDFGNGKKNDGYMPIYGWDIDYKYIENLSENQDIKPIYTPGSNRDSFFFVEKYYNIDKVGIVIIDDEVQRIQSKKCKKIIFKNWINYSQAGEPSTITRKIYNKLINKPILGVAYGHDDWIGHGRQYINQDNRIDLPSLEFLANFYPPSKHSIFNVFSKDFIKIYDNKSTRIRKSRLQAGLSNLKLYFEQTQFETKNDEVNYYRIYVLDKLKAKMKCFQAAIEILSQKPEQEIKLLLKDYKIPFDITNIKNSRFKYLDILIMLNDYSSDFSKSDSIYNAIIKDKDITVLEFYSD